MNAKSMVVREKEEKSKTHKKCQIGVDTLLHIVIVIVINRHHDGHHHCHYDHKEEEKEEGVTYKQLSST